jgi:hypothetical protein
MNLVKCLVKSRRMRWAEYVACMGERSGTYRVLVGKSEGKRPLRRCSCWEDNIKMDLRGVGLGMVWIDLAQDGNRWGLL